jgi:hypothetical protein
MFRYQAKRVWVGTSPHLTFAVSEKAPVPCTTRNQRSKIECPGKGHYLTGDFDMNFSPQGIVA